MSIAGGRRAGGFSSGGVRSCVLVIEDELLHSNVLFLFSFLREAADTIFFSSTGVQMAWGVCSWEWIY